MVVRDILWAWGNPEMVKPGAHSVDSYAQASPRERARMLGVPNVVMAGLGMPKELAEAQALAEGVREAGQVVWEISPDEDRGGRPFVYTEAVAEARAVAAGHPQTLGVLLDDMSTVQISKGLTPAHIRALREAAASGSPRLQVWGVLYTMTLGRPDIADYVRELDVINLWTWHAKDTVDLEANVAQCEARLPDRPIVLGLYLHDYGDGRPIPAELLRGQCETALKSPTRGASRALCS